MTRELLVLAGVIIGLAFGALRFVARVAGRRRDFPDTKERREMHVRDEARNSYHER